MTYDAVVTGAAGFLGGALVRRLSAAGQRVHAVDVSPEPTGKGEARYTIADCSNPRQVTPELLDARVIYHAVAHVPLRRPGREFQLANAVSPGLVARVASQAGAEHMVLVSSSAVYGLPRDVPFHESAAPQPFEPYGRAKLEGEKNATAALQGTSTSLAIVRPRTIVGPGRLGIFGILFQFIEQGRQVPVIGRGQAPLQLLHTEDAVDALLVAGQGLRGVMAVGAEEYQSLSDDLESLIRHAGSGSRLQLLPERTARAALAVAWAVHASPLSPWHYRGYGAPFAVETNILQGQGWKPKFSNADTLADSWNWYVNHSRRTGASVHTSQPRQGIISVLRGLT